MRPWGRKGDGMGKSTRLGWEMVAYFASEEEDLPSFVRFARKQGMTLAELESLKRRTAFAAAWRECEEILCDRIIYGAMHKRFDASFAKYLLSTKFGFSEKADPQEEDFTLRIRVLEEEA